MGKVFRKKGKSNAIKRIKNRNSDNERVKYIMANLYMSEDFITKLKNDFFIIKKPNMVMLSLLEKIAYKIKQISLQRDITQEDIEKIETIFHGLSIDLNRINCIKNEDVKIEVELLEQKIEEIILHMKSIIEKDKNRNVATVDILNEIIKLSSNLEPNTENLGQNFSYLQGAIDEAYEKSEKRERIVKGMAIGTAALIGAGAVTSVAVDVYRDAATEKVERGLAYLYGENNITEDIKSGYFESSGRVKKGAEAKLKNEMLNKLLKDKINDDLKEKTDAVGVDKVNLSYGKNKLDRYRYKYTYDGVTIKYITNDGKKYSIERKNESVFDQHDGFNINIEEDKEAIRIRKYLESLSTDKIIEVANDEEEATKFDKNLGSVIKAISTNILAEKINELTADTKDEHEL